MPYKIVRALKDLLICRGCRTEYTKEEHEALPKKKVNNSGKPWPTCKECGSKEFDADWR